MTIKQAISRKIENSFDVCDQESQHQLAGNILVLTAGHNASTAMYFDYLPQLVNGIVRVVTVSADFDLLELARASCVVVVRHFDPYQQWLDAANLLGIPVYYYLDDNFVELSKHGTVLFQEDFSLDGLREKLCAFAGVLLSTPSLVDYFEKHLIHDKLLYFPPCYTGNSLIQGKQTDEEVTVAFVGGGHRQDGLVNYVFPALKRITESGINLHLVLGGLSDELATKLKKHQSNELKITTLKYELDWKRALLKMARYAPDILFHAPSDNPNNYYKTLNVALCANLLDALLIVPAQPPYDLVEFSGCAVQVNLPFEAASWLGVLSKALEVRDSWDEIKRNNARFCKISFSGEENSSVILNLLETSPRVGMLDVENRLRTLYRSKGSAVIPSLRIVPENLSLKTSLLELSDIRKSLRARRLRNLFRRKQDMWAILSPSFEGVRQYILQENSRKSGMLLELSDSLHDRPYAEYMLPFKKGFLENYTVVLASEGVHDGSVGIEIVSSTQEILSHVVLSLSSINLHQPVIFPLARLKVEEGDYFVRLFVKTEWPIYLVEFAKYRLGMRRKSMIPFCQPVYSQG